MELGIAVARGPVDEGGGHQSRGLDPALAAGAPAGHGGVALEVGQPFGDRPVVGGPDGGRGLRVAQSPQHRDRLGGREGEVEPRHPCRATSPSPPAVSRPCGEIAGQDGPEVVWGDFPRRPRAAVPLPIQVPGASPVPV